MLHKHNTPHNIFISWCIYEEYCVLKRIVFKKNPKKVINYARRANYMLKWAFLPNGQH